MKTGITIDFETADSITLATLKEQRDYIKKELKDHHIKGSYMHEDDVVHNKKIIKALNKVIRYFGG
jgi:hypothetical protein